MRMRDGCHKHLSADRVNRAQQLLYACTLRKVCRRNRPKRSSLSDEHQVPLVVVRDTVFRLRISLATFG